MVNGTDLFSVGDWKINLSRFVALIALLLPVRATAGMQAGLMLMDSSTELCLANDTAWQLANEAALDEADDTVTWTITATRGETSADHLDVDGYVSILNTGLAGATIGNIVVNLQAQTSGPKPKWVTLSSDVADATLGDAATFARVVAAASSESKSSFTENGASSTLSFTDASNNTMFSLVPQLTLAPGTSINLLYGAKFDNTILGLAVGTQVRAEVIVTFGNAGARGGSGSVASNVDINGNGVIDADEASVRSVPTRITRNVPALERGNDYVTLTDSPADLTPTGTVVVTSASTNIGGGSGTELIHTTTTRTVTAAFNAGTDGGTITNCAHLAGASKTKSVTGPPNPITGIAPVFTFPCVTGVDIDACDTETIGGGTCDPGTCCGDCGWEDGDFITYPQSAWGEPPSGDNAGAILAANFSTVYPAGFVEVGIPGSGGFSMVFTNAPAIRDYLPAGGAPAALNADLDNPLTSSSGAFGGQVLALELNVDFSDAGITLGTLGTSVGDLTLCNLTDLTLMNGLTVRQFLVHVNQVLGGGPHTHTYAELNTLTDDLNKAFDTGFVSDFAQDHLCP